LVWVKLKKTKNPNQKTQPCRHWRKGTYWKQFFDWKWIDF